MRRTALSTTLLSALAICLVAAPCATQGPTSKAFGPGALVIPMDNCYQKRDSSSSSVTTACNSTRDDGVFRAYGLVYFLLKHGVPVYWAIDGATPKTDKLGVDVQIPAPASGAVVKKYRWSDGTFTDFFPATTAVNYLGGPFVIDAGDAATALDLFQNNADFARFKSEAMVDIHQVQPAAASFTVAQVRPLAGPPPRIAILAVNPQPYHKTSLDVMYKYVVAAGLDDPNCDGATNCAGGLGSHCDKTVITKYLNNTLCGFSNCGPTCSSCSSWVDPAPSTRPATPTPSGIQNAKFNDPGKPGKIFDLLCDGDFVPPTAGKTYADTDLALGDYKLLWIPHWETQGTTPTGSSDANVVPALPASTAQDRLAWQLRSIASFVEAGNNLFVECQGIQALEGVAGEDNQNSSPVGIPATRFQTPNGMFKWNSHYTLAPLLDPAHPNVQIGDFTYADVSGAIETYYPDATNPPTAAYRDGIKRLITETQSGTPSPPFHDISSTIQVVGRDSVPKGNVAYLGGHDYSPAVGNTPGSGGYTAGTRIVLNTLFNLGFACADPKDANGNPVACTTNGLGACAKGHMRCTSGGGVDCLPDTPPSPEVCDGIDNDCNGLIDEDGVCNPPTCTPGATRQCYSGPEGTAGHGACKAGTQTCTGGFWGPCEGEVLPTPEACNAKDDDCNGTVDDGNLCAVGAACTNGVCLPTTCNNENARCPSGFDCTAGQCVAQNCPTAPCPAGQVCEASANVAAHCVDPCANVQCGTGSACSGGACVSGGCALTGCADALVCVNGVCVEDLCASAQCPTGTFCRLGDCVRSCAYVDCKDGEACSADGFCEPACSPACGAGQICVQGTCQTDPCTGVTCGVGQVCQYGACVDEGCAHVTCAVGTCTDGQCTGGDVKKSETHAVSSGGGGGCASGGDAGLLGLLLLAAALAGRRQAALRAAVARAPASPARRRWPRSGAALSAALALVLGSSACSKSGTPTCSAGQTACGSACADLTSSATNCGVCGRACLTGYQCVASGCALDTGNPYVKSISPATVAVGSQVKIALTTVGLKDGARARVSGLGVDQEVAVADPTTSPTATFDFSGARLGTATVKVVNPVPTAGATGWLVSNGVPVTVISATVLRGVLPSAGASQDVGPLTLTLVGAGFVDGAATSMKLPSGEVRSLSTTFVDPATLTVTGVVPSELAVGTYDITVTNPGGLPSSPLKFSITEGAPTLTSITPTCIEQNGVLSGSATGTNFYPTSVVYAKAGTFSSRLDTQCLTTVDALGRCSDGKLRVTQDLSGAPANCYEVTVVNPGSSPQVSAVLHFLVAASCPSPGTTCP